jgi:hypothetical protein
MAFFLMCKGINPNIMDKFGMNPMDYAKSKEVEKCLKILGAKSSDFGRKRFDGVKLPNSRFDKIRTIFRDLKKPIFKKKMEDHISKRDLEFDEFDSKMSNVPKIKQSDKVTHEDFIIHDKLGEGSFGDVYLVEKLDTKK